MKPGDTVSCFGGDLLHAQLMRHMPSACPEPGLVYTVTGVFRNCPSCGQDHVTLKEIPSPFINGYPARWFKPWTENDFQSFLSAHMSPNGEIFEG